MDCYCGSGQNFTACCERLLRGEGMASGPVELMRSRYSAFVLKNMDYVVATTDPQARAEMDLKGNQEWMDSATFTQLEVIQHTNEGNKGIVEFKAHFTIDGKPYVHHEVSKFRKQAGVWYFRDGRVIPLEASKNGVG